MRAGFISWKRARNSNGVPKHEGRAIVFNVREVFFVEGAVDGIPTEIGATYTPQGSVGGLVDFGDGKTELITLTLTSFDISDRPVNILQNTFFRSNALHCTATDPDPHSC